MANRAQLKAKFETGDTPSEADFANLIESQSNLEDDVREVTGNTIVITAKENYYNTASPYTGNSVTLDMTDAVKGVVKFKVATQEITTFIGFGSVIWRNAQLTGVKNSFYLEHDGTDVYASWFKSAVSQSTVQLTTPTLAAVAGNGETTGTISNEHASADGGVLETSVDAGATWTAVVGYTFATKVYTVSGANGTNMLWRFNNTSTNALYTDSAIATANATPIAPSQTQLTTPTFSLAAGSSFELDYSSVVYDAAAGTSVMQISPTGANNWTTATGYTSGNTSGTITGDGNGNLTAQTYDVRMKSVSTPSNSESPYSTIKSATASGLGTFSPLPIIVATSGNTENVISLPTPAIPTPDSSTLEVSISGGAFNPVAGFTDDSDFPFTQTGLTNGLVYDYRYTAIKTGYNSATATANATPVAPSVYTFANTHKLSVASSGDYVKIVDDALYPSNGGGVDKAVTYEFYIETGAAVASNHGLLKLTDSANGNIISDVQWAPSGSLAATFRTNSSNYLHPATAAGALAPNSLNHVLISKTLGHDPSDIKIIINGNNMAIPNLNETGNYTGLPNLIGNAVFEIPRANIPSAFTACQTFRIHHTILSADEITYLANVANGGVPIGLTPALEGLCVQENLFNGDAAADNIGTDGTTEGSATYVNV